MAFAPATAMTVDLALPLQVDDDGVLAHRQDADSRSNDTALRSRSEL